MFLKIQHTYITVIFIAVYDPVALRKTSNVFFKILDIALALSSALGVKVKFRRKKFKLLKTWRNIWSGPGG